MTILPHQASLPRRRRPVLGLIVTRLLMAVVVAVFAGFGLYVSHIAAVRQPADVGKADAIIVLTGGQDRILPAYQLLASGAAKRLLISGVNTSTRKADLAAAARMDKELLDCCIDLDHQARDTIGNAVHSARWMRENGFSSAILVTSNYHMPRASRELARFAGTAAIIEYPLVASDLTGGKWLTEPDTVRVLVIEYVKLCLSYARSLVTAAPARTAVARL